MHGTGFDQAFHHRILDDNKERMYQIIKACLRFNVQSDRYLKFKVLGNSGKSVTLETLGLTKFSKHVFQEQGIHDFRKPGTCEASNS
jgi:hypothetical protein